MEFIINNVIKIHPLALLHLDQVDDEARRADRRAHPRLRRQGRSTSSTTWPAASPRSPPSQYPDPVIVRMSDFKTNEYADLIGGRPFEPRRGEPHARLPRGVALLQRRATARVLPWSAGPSAGSARRSGLDNVVVMIPFCRTPEEADRVLEVLAEQGLERGEDGLRGLRAWPRSPPTSILAEQFAERFDGFSIGSQRPHPARPRAWTATRPSLADLFDERHEAVKRAMRQLIETAHDDGRKVGICGQAPSDYPEFAAFLVVEGIDSISLNPDSILGVLPIIAAAEAATKPTSR